MSDNRHGNGQIALLGVVRNGGTGLLGTLPVLDQLRASLDVAQVIIATNDNTDDTDAALDGYADGDGTVQIIRRDGLVDRYPRREDRIAAARNLALEALFDIDRRPEFTIMLDLDGPNAALNPDDVARVLQSTTVPWDAVFANQPAAFFDLYALRHPVWCPTNCWRDYVRAVNWSLRLGKQKLKARHIHSRQYSIPVDHPWIEVDSAFGGLGIYRTSGLEGLSYSAREANGQVVCEHVPLHRQMRAAGARLFIAPELVNQAPEEHLGPASGAPFPYSPGRQPA